MQGSPGPTPNVIPNLGNDGLLLLLHLGLSPLILHQGEGAHTVHIEGTHLTKQKQNHSTIVCHLLNMVIFFFSLKIKRHYEHFQSLRTFSKSFFK